MGDIIGRPYEFDRGNKTKDFPLFSDASDWTDDTVMTIAVADAFMNAMNVDDLAWTRKRLIRGMQRFGKRYPDAGYGTKFRRWVKAYNPKPYGSFGNGSAMRVSSAAWLFDDLDTVRKMAQISSEVTHNHPEGIKGAESVASAIYLARTGSSKEEIRKYVEENFQYDLSRTCDEIRPDYHHIEDAQRSVPEAIIAFMEGESFEDVIRTAVSLGGDCDTTAAIAGSIAEAFYGVPEELKEACRKRIPADMREVLARFDGVLNQKQNHSADTDCG